MSDSTDKPKSLFHHWRMIEHDAAWFILANCLDVAMTWIALMYGGGPGLRMVEGNRIAAFLHDHWGFKGMFGLKFGVVSMVCLIALIIAHKRLETALWLLRFGTLIVTCVVIYSVLLYVRIRSA